MMPPGGNMPVPQPSGGMTIGAPPPEMSGMPMDVRAATPPAPQMPQPPMPQASLNDIRPPFPRR